MKMVFNFIKRLVKVPTLKQVAAEVMDPSTSKLCTKPIVWIDCEMTGLDLKKDRLMEIACLVTDHYLNVTAKGPNIIINQPDTLLNSMDKWCTKTHAEVRKFPFCS